MSTVAVIKDGIVVNLIVADADFRLPGFLLIPGEDARIGDRYEDGHFNPPALEPEPYVVPIPLLRQRVQRLGMWEPFAGFVAQHPTLWLELLSTESGVDPHHPAFPPAFDELAIPQAVRDYILAPPSEGVGDPPEVPADG